MFENKCDKVVPISNSDKIKQLIMWMAGGKKKSEEYIVWFGSMTNSELEMDLNQVRVYTIIVLYMCEIDWNLSEWRWDLEKIPRQCKLFQ